MFFLSILSVIEALLLVNIVLAADPDRQEPRRGRRHLIYGEDEHGNPIARITNSQVVDSGYSGSVTDVDGDITLLEDRIIITPNESRDPQDVVVNSEYQSGSINNNRGTIIYGPEGIVIAPQRSRRGNAPNAPENIPMGSLGPMLETRIADFQEYSRQAGEEGRRLGEEGRRWGEEGRRWGEEGRRLGEEGRRLGEEGRRWGEEGRRCGEEGRRVGEEGRRLGEEGRRWGEEGRRLGAVNREIGRQAHEIAGQMLERSGGELYIIQVTASGLTSSRITILQGSEVIADNDNMISNLPPGAIVCGRIKNSLIWTLDGVPYAGENIIENYESSGDAITFDLREVVREAQSLITITLWGNTISHNYT